ncbi:MAG TPA: WXG100 family type VII secretion target [Tetrasphaera sp.]|nr:WXG100 family type VII secretion target [Tetrasphaera sp.]
MAFKGMDVDEARTGVSNLKKGVESLRQAKSQLNGHTNHVHGIWKGQDSDKFKGDWDGTHAPKIDTIIGALEQFIGELEKQIREQESASA